MEHLEELISNFTNKFGCEAISAKDIDYEGFAYNPVYRVVICDFEFSLRMKVCKDFMDSIKRQNPKVKLDFYTWALLHELGHHHTITSFTREELRKCYKKRFRIRKTHATLPYYNLPDEYAATAWAVGYANSHINEVKELSRKIQMYREVV